jgi:hypothetical protein
VSETAKTTVAGPAYPAPEAPTRNAGAHAREEPPPNRPQTAITDSDRTGGLLGRIRSEFAAPEPWADRQPPACDLWRYAKDGLWTSEDSVARSAGIVWTYTIATALTVIFVYGQWVAARLAGTTDIPIPVKAWNYRAPAPVELWRHATNADSTAGRIRALAGLPLSVTCAYGQWLAARPSRTLVAALVAALLVVAAVF